MRSAFHVHHRQPAGGRSSTSHGPLGLLVILGLTIMVFASSCSTSSESSDGGTNAQVTTQDADVAVETDPDSADARSTSTTPNEPTPVELAAPDLVGLGQLTALYAEPVRQTFDSRGGVMVLPDGASLEVPNQAFTTSTEVTAVLVNMLFTKYLDEAPTARIYHISTADSVALRRPVVLEVLKASDTVQVFGREDNRWFEETLAVGEPTTRIEISGFSAVPHLVVDRPDCTEPINSIMCNGQTTELFRWTLMSEASPNQTLIDPLFLQCTRFPFPVRLPSNTTEQAEPAPADCAAIEAPPAEQPATTDEAASGGTTTTPAPTATTEVPDAAPLTDAAGTDTRPAATTEPTAAPTTEPTPTVVASRCTAPELEVVRNGNEGCVNPAVCVATGPGWRVSRSGTKCLSPTDCDDTYNQFITRTTCDNDEP